MLPSPLTSFIGRDQETAALAELLSQIRLITLLGPGGVGKTRLAIHVAGLVAPRFADGVRFADLTPLTEPALLLPAVAHALGVGRSGDEPLVARLCTALTDRRLLLVLDNCEQLLAAAADLAALLASAPGLSVLATSRAPLRISGEREYWLGSLGLPDTAESAALASPAPAVRLFAERAVAVQPGFVLDGANIGAVAAICVRLEGLPLAIELAAARARSLSPVEILARLERRLPLLRGGPQDAPPRQRALRDTIAWSYELLGPQERWLIAALAVFSGGWSLAAAVAVCGRPDEDELTLIDRLDTLVANSLVQTRELASATRYTMLETLREFAAERLAEAPEAPALRARHALWAHSLAHAALAGLTGPEQRSWYERIESEHDNLRAALAWAIAHDPALALKIAWPLWRFWWQRGYVAEGRAWLQRVLDAAPPALDGAAPTAHALDGAQALYSAGNMAWADADYEAALASFQASLAIREALRDAGLIVRGQFAVAMALANLERYDEALTLYLACLAFEREHDDAESMVSTLNNIGFIHQQRGDYAAAYDYYREAAALSRRFGDAARTAQKLVFASEALLELGRTAEALPLTVEALQLARASGGHLALIEALECAACVLAAEGDAARAVQLLGTAETARRQRGIVLPPDDYPRLVRAARTAHARLGGAAFARLWSEAAERTLEHALELALAPPRPALPDPPPASTALPPPQAPRLDGAALDLSPREREVLALLAAGLSDRQIAARLIVGVNTINSHTKSIYSKLGVRSRVAATRFAIEHGLAADLEEDPEG
jgi:predicted ATPase/DNA-binding NarL/FixJ family response regulator